MLRAALAGAGGAVGAAVVGAAVVGCFPLVGAAVAGAWVEYTVVAAIADDDESTLIVALDRAEPAGEFACIALAMPPDDTASVNCVDSEVAKLLASVSLDSKLTSKEIPVELDKRLRRPEYVTA